MKNCSRIVANLERKIQVMKSESKNVFEEIEFGVFTSKKALRRLRSKILLNGFATPEEEWLFFKTIKTKPSGYLIYYLSLAKFEINKPQNAQKKVKRYIENQITKYQKYFREHKDFYQYLERNRTDKDKKYFQRAINHVNFHPDSLSFCMDEDFSTSHDYIAAKIFAHKLLIERLNKELKALEIPRQLSEMAESQSQESIKLQWTGNKVDLIELIYAIHESGTINNGNIGIKEFAQKVSQILNFEIDGLYQTYRDLRSRKINQTKFLDRMTTNLLRRMDQADE